MKKILVVLTLFLAGWPALAGAGTLGLQVGSDATGVSSSYSAAELFWHTPVGSPVQILGIALQPRFHCGLGAVRSGDDNGGWLAAGGSLVYRSPDLPLELEAGFRPAWFPDYRYNSDDFGGPIQFASHIGAVLSLPPFALSYRFQHLSNADLYHSNPGLDLHLFGISASY